MMMRLLMAGLLMVLVNCTKKPVELKTGAWRGVINMQNQQLPFQFEIVKNENDFDVYLHNAEEKILLDEVSIVGDSVFVTLHVFDAALRAKIDGHKLTGTFVKYYAPSGSLPFSATHGDQYRFTKEQQAVIEFTGNYAVTFMSPSDTVPSVGIFNQKGNIITGTFLTPTGDYRYLEGNVVGDELRLSTFDGNHAFIFTAIKKGDSLKGHFYSGKTGYESWVAIKDDRAALPDAELLTYLKPGFDQLEFSFPDLSGKMITPQDERYKDKVLILQIFGTWCPNCMDETKFLKTWYDENKDRGVEILGLAYERKDDFDYASGQVKKMKTKWNVGYDFVIAGVNDKAKASETLPALSRVLAFPTTIFIGKDGKVKHIHTGFSGPGTGVYYDQFKERFNTIVNELLSEHVALSKQVSR
jgi:thiol-disulfide isomerase/thioredoxin